MGREPYKHFIYWFINIYSLDLLHLCPKWVNTPAREMAKSDFGFHTYIHVLREWLGMLFKGTQYLFCILLKHCHNSFARRYVLSMVHLYEAAVFPMWLPFNVGPAIYYQQPLDFLPSKVKNDLVTKLMHFEELNWPWHPWPYPFWTMLCGYNFLWDIVFRLSSGSSNRINFYSNF